MVWLGGQSGSGYGYIRVKVIEDGVTDSLVIGVHKVSLLCMLRQTQLPVLCTASHRCGTKLCCDPEHLSAEPDWINQRRTQCMKRGSCYGHGSYQLCIL